MMALALAVDFWLALATVLLVVFSWWIFSELRERARQTSVTLARRAGNILKALTAHLQHNRLLGNWSLHSTSEEHAFDEQLRRFEQSMLAQAATTSLLAPMITFFVLVGGGVVLLLAGFNVLRESPRISVADFALLASALVAIMYPLMRLEQLVVALPEAEHAAAEIFVYLDRQPRIGQLPDAAPLEELSREIAFQRVTLADVSGHSLLDNISFSLSARRTTVIFSSNDATPLALAGLLPRFCDPAAGQVLFDNRDVRLATIDSVRRQVALLLPESIIADGTLTENIVGDDQHFTRR